MRSSLGVLTLVLFVACPGGAAAASPSTHPYVMVNLAPKATAAQRRAIEHRLTRNPSVRSVELITRKMQLATGRRLYKILLPPDDLTGALAELKRRTTNDVFCVRVVSDAAANRLFASYNLKQRGVVSISKFSGGEMLSDCNLVDGLEHTRRSVKVVAAG